MAKEQANARFETIEEVKQEWRELRRGYAEIAQSYRKMRQEYAKLRRTIWLCVPITIAAGAVAFFLSFGMARHFFG